MKLCLENPALTFQLAQNPYISLINGGSECSRASFTINGPVSIEEGQKITGTIEVKSDDDMVLNTINADTFLRYELSSYEETSYLTFTNDPIPEPPPEPIPPTEEELLAMAKMGKPEYIMGARDAAILNGVEVQTDYGLERFSLTEKDRTLLLGIYSMVEAGATVFPYHSIAPDNSNNMCNIYSNADIAKIAMAAFGLITYHETYANMLVQWVARETDHKVVETITYGCNLPPDLQEYFEMIMTAASILSVPTPAEPNPGEPETPPTEETI